MATMASASCWVLTSYPPPAPVGRRCQKESCMVVKTVTLVAGTLLFLGLFGRAVADVAMEIQEAEETIAVFKQADPGISRFFDSAVGYAVFRTIGKGAVGIGGAGGSGVVFEKGAAVGKGVRTQGTRGLPRGGAGD